MSVATERPAVAGLQAREELLSKLSPGPGKTAAEVAENQRVRIHRAMIDIVGERGYEAVTIRELAQVAGVSSRACYENFTSKEECFLRTHEGVGKRILRHVASAESHAGDAEGRLRLIFEAFAGELARDPRAARLFLVEPYVAGPEAVRQLRGAMRVLQSRVAASFVLSPGEGEFPEQVIEAVVAGAEGVARAMLCAGRERELASLGDSLEQWALR
ncbi:MAG: TetR/AcrR family transcriptional regulator, partial [Solirubrobacterales bacterium]